MNALAIRVCRIRDTLMTRVEECRKGRRGCMTLSDEERTG